MNAQEKLETPEIKKISENPRPLPFPHPVDDFRPIGNIASDILKRLVPRK
jgi:hypothetical protein